MNPIKPIPHELENLPIVKNLSSFNLKEDFVLIGATGTGKTMIIPPSVAFNNNRLVILRQPTRKIAQMTHKTLIRFWGEEASIGLITSEDKDISFRFLNHYKIIVVTDGVLSFILPKLDIDRTTLIIDEVHWQMSSTEIELSIALNYKKSNPNFQIILLSATIDPYIFVNFFERTLSPTPTPEPLIKQICSLSNSQSINSFPQPQKLKVYYSEGITYPMVKKIIKIKDIKEDLDPIIREFCQEMINMKDFGLFFFSTRQQCMDAALKYFPLLPTIYYHADTPNEIILDFFTNNTHGMIFATIALSTSLTLPFYSTKILDQTNGSYYDELTSTKVNQYGIPCEFNEIIQKAGRVSRTRPGEATLITLRDITWDDIKPSNITPPLKKELPISAALISSSYGLDISKINTLSNLSPSQITNSIKKLTSMKFIDSSNNITSLGKRAMSLPLEPEDAKLLLSTPPSLKCLTAAFLSFPSGMFYLLDSSQSSKFPELSSNYCFNSIPLTKAKILQDALLNKSSLKQWCSDNALSYKKISLAIYKYNQILSKLNTSSDLESIDIATISASYKSLIQILMRNFSFDLSRTGNNVFGIYTFFSDLNFFNLEDIDIPKISGKHSLFTTSKKLFGRIQDATITSSTISL